MPKTDPQRRPELRPDQVLPFRATAYDVARVAGVSQSTVSRCFAPNSRISGKTRSHVQGIAATLGYTPNIIARSLILRRSGIVGIVVTKQSIQACPEMLTALGDALAAEDRRLLLITVPDEDAASQVISSLFGFPLDGLICCVTLRREDILAFAARGVPVVLFNRYDAAVDSVCTDHEKGAEDVATLLFAAGHRRFLCVAGPADAPVSHRRTQGFVKRLHRLGVTTVHIRTADYSYTGGAETFRDYLADEERPDAVFCANDQLALGVLDTCRFVLGWSMPEDISVVGFDDIPEASRPAYDLTTIRQDLSAMAQTTVSLLLRRADRPGDEPEAVLVPGVIVDRRSARMAPSVLEDS